MLHGEPPFGYGGPELPRRIAAGLPKEPLKGTDTAPSDAPQCAEKAPTARSNIDANTDGSTDGNADQGNFLPIVR